MTWAQRFKRVFNIDIETCRECGGALRIIACFEDPVVIKKIMTHLHEKVSVIETIRKTEIALKRPFTQLIRQARMAEPDKISGEIV